MDDLMQKIVALCKRRGFIFPGSEIYGGLSNSWDYGPLGVQLKKNIKDMWWKRFVEQREDIVGLDAALIMNPKVWEASGHIANFTDPLVECKKCHSRFRADHVKDDTCPNCGGKKSFTETKVFNLMFKTFIGPAEESANIAYFRPETAQAMFVDFKQVLESTRIKIPFGIAQIGKAFRNEITPGNFVFRTREFEQMEIEYFIAPPKDDNEWEIYFESWRQNMISWITDDLGIKKESIIEFNVPDGERAHYSKKTIDFMFKYPFGESELYGLAYRTDYDLTQHLNFSHENIKYRDLTTNEEFIPHVIEPSFGVDRTILAVLVNAYEEQDGKVILKLKPSLAPFKAAVFPLLHNKPELVDLARKIYLDLKTDFVVAWDDRGNIGKRYASQDEIGTPFCITVDFESLQDKCVTVRDRDTGNQERIEVESLGQYLKARI